MRLWTHQKPCPTGWSQKHQTILGHINDDAQALIADMAQGWIKEVTLNFVGASHEEQIGESYTWSQTLES
jgi:hypothetical protein